jgi:hypothetical protein
LKPDVSAPGFSITSAGVGTGDDSSVLSGTSMAAPQVSGAAVLLRQLHPAWSPARIKAVIMNQATRTMKNNDLSTPVAATVMGSGRIRVFQSAIARSLAAPGSLSFGLQFAEGTESSVRSFRVFNTDNVGHDYNVSASTRFLPEFLGDQFDPGVVALGISLNGSSFGSTKSFHLAPHKARTVWIKLTLDPSVITSAEQLFGWYYFHPNVDGTIRIGQNGPHKDVLRVAWHVAPLSASQDSLSESFLDLTGGPATMEMVSAGTGQPYGDLYLLGGLDSVNSTGEEDLVAIGARSFTGDSIDGVPEGVPPGTDPFLGLTWQQFLTRTDEPTEPVEFGVQEAAVHNTTETLEIDVKVDTGADGVFPPTPEGQDLQADYLVVKLTGQGGIVCVFDLSLADPFDDCAQTYFADYNNYNANVVGLVVDAQAVGLSDATHTLSYQVTACTGRFSGDVPGTFCDTAGDFDDDTGTYTAFLDVTDPALDITPLVCQGFWSGGACDGGDPIVVSTGSAGPGDNPSILALFPDNAPSRIATVVETQT